MRRPTVRATWRNACLALLVLLPGAPYVVAQREAATNLIARRSTLAAPSPQAVNRLPAGSAMPLAQVAPPGPSGAEPPYPLNHTFDAEPRAVGDPPVNHGFEEPGYPTGAPPDNHDLSAAPVDAGAPPQNHDFGTGDFTAWTTVGAPTIQSDATRGPWARLVSGQTVTTAAFTVDPAAQALVFEAGYVSPPWTKTIEVSVLTGADFATATVVGRWSCSCVRWETVGFDAAPYHGQTVKLRLARISGEVGIDAVRQQVVFPGYALTGRIGLGNDAGDTYARLDSGSLTSPALVVAAEAQYLTFWVRGLTTGTDYFYPYVLSGPDYATATSLSNHSAPDAWTAIRINMTAWSGQTVKLRIAHNTGAVGVDDLGSQSVAIPHWEVTGQALLVADGPTGAYVSTDGSLTSEPFVLSPEAQRLSLRAMRGTNGATSFYLELLRGPGFSTVTHLDYVSLSLADDWQTPVVSVAPYAGETVKIRVRRYTGRILVDEIGLTETVVPGWTVTDGTIAAGEDPFGTYVTALNPGGAIKLRSSSLSTGVLDRSGSPERRFFSVAYQIDDPNGGFVYLYFVNAAGQLWTVFGDAVNDPTGYRVAYFPLYDFMGTTGTLRVHLNSGRLYSLADNVAREQVGEPFAEQVGLGVDAATGGFGLVETDLTVAGGPLPLTLTRYYAGHSDGFGPLGYRWTHTYDTRLVVNADGDAGVIYGSGRAEFFDWQQSSGFTGFVPADPRVTSTLTRYADGSYGLETKRDLTYGFQADGRLVYIADRNDNRIELVYDATTGKLATVTDPGGRTLTFAYDPATRELLGVTGPDGAVVQYAYDAADDLVAVTDPVGGVRRYEYSRHRLTRVVDENGDQVVANTLDHYNRVVAQTDALGNDLVLAYATPAQGVTRVTDREGAESFYHYDRFGRTTAVVDPAGLVTGYVYDGAGYRTKVVDPAGNETVFAYDPNGDPTRVADPLGNATLIVYDAADHPTSLTDARGNVTMLTYDALGNLIGRTDPLGNVTSYTVDGRGNVLTETDPLNRTTTFTYDAANNLTSRTDPLGHTWSWTYDVLGRLRTETDPFGNTTSFAYSLRGLFVAKEDAAGGRWEYQYDAARNLTSAQDPLGRTTTWTYDERRLPLTKTDPAGFVWTYAYDANGRTTAVTDPLGNATSYAYDAAGRLVSITDPLDQTATYAYDSAGRLASETDPLGRTSGYVYDDAGRLTGKTLPNGAVWTYTYDASGNLLTETNPLNRTTTHAYDALDRLTSTTDALGNVTTLAYDAAGQLVSETDALGGVTTYGYDAAGRLTSETDPLNHTTTYGYDAADRRTSVGDPLGRATSYGYDALGRVVSVADPLGHVNRTTYDAAGQVTQRTRPSGGLASYAYDPRGLLTSTSVRVSETLALLTGHAYDAAGRRTSTSDPRGHATTFGYDAAGRLVSETDARGGIVRFAYDAAGQPTGITNPRGKTTSFTYDALGNISTETDPLNRPRSSEYDLAGRLTETTNARGTVVTYTHDALDRPTGLSYPGGSVVRTYDALGRQTAMTDPTGATGWTYDAAGRVTQVASPQGSVSYGYDAAGQRTSLTLPGNRTATYAYDAAGQLTGLTDWQGRATTFGYDADGNRTGVVRPNGVSTAYSYDGAGRLAMVEHAAGATMLQRFVYTLDHNGNRTGVTASGAAVATAGTETYSLDELNRLTNVTYANGDTLAFTYDATGNRLTQTTNGDTAAFTYDDADQLLSDGSLTYLHDADGNLVAAGLTTFAWDWADRLTSLTTDGATTSYAYDGDGMRVGKTGGGGTTGYLWDREAGLPLLLDDGGQAYLHAGGVLAGVDGAGSATYTLADGLGSVRGRTDGAGAVVGSADYDAFGATRASTGANGTFGFAGEQRDPESGLSHLRARQYAPGLGRFLSRDSVVPNAPGTQGYHPYAYAANNPATWTDPGGRLVAAPALPLAGPLALGLALAAAFLFLAFLLLYLLDCHAYGECFPDQAFAGFRERAAAAFAAAAGAVGEAVREGVDETFDSIADFLRSQRQPQPPADPRRDPEPKRDLPPLPPDVGGGPEEEDDDRKCRFKAFTARNFRHNLKCLTGMDPPNAEAHHIFPRKFQLEFDLILGENINHVPNFGTWWEETEHQAEKGNFNLAWQVFFRAERQRAGGLPSRQETFEWGWELGNTYGLTLYFTP